MGPAENEGVVYDLLVAMPELALRELLRRRGHGEYAPGAGVAKAVLALAVLDLIGQRDRSFFADLASITPGHADVVRAAEARYLGPSIEPISPFLTAEQASRVCAWLARNYPKPSGRRALLSAAEIAGEKDESWGEIVSRLSCGNVERILLVADGEASPGDPAPIGAIRSSRMAEGLDSVLGGMLEAQIQQAGAYLDAENYQKAAEEFRRLEDNAEKWLATADTDGARQALHRARVNLVAALIGMSDHVAAKLVLDRTDHAYLTDRGRTNMGRFLVIEDALDAALGVVEGMTTAGSAAVRKMVSIRRGVLPDDLGDDPDVALQAAIFLINRREALSAARTVVGLAEVAGLNDFGKATVCRVLYLSLLQTVLEMTPVPIPTEERGRFLAVASRLRKASRDAQAERWLEVDRARSSVEQIDLGLADEAQEVPADAPAWLSSLERYRGGTPAEALGGIEDLARLWPGRMHIAFLLAGARMAADDTAGAVDAAGHAFRLLPGLGQRMRYAQALAMAGDHETVWALLEESRRGGEPEALRLSCWAAEVVAPAEAVALSAAYLSKRPTSSTAMLTRARALLLCNDVAGARACAFDAMRIAGDKLTIDGLQQVAAVALVSGLPADQGLLREVATHLYVLGKDDPRAEGARLQVLLALGEPDDQPRPNWAQLIKAGVARSASLDEVREQMRETWQRNVLLDRVWGAGALPFERWVEARGLPPGAFGLGVIRGESRVAAPQPRVSGSPVWHGKWCLLGALGIELLVALREHRAFMETVAGVAMPEDTFARVVNGGMGIDAETNRRQLEAVDEIWNLIEGIGRASADSAPDGTTILTSEDASAVRSWLASRGRLPAAAGSGGVAPWSPPVSATITWGFAFAFNDAKLMSLFIAECRREGVRLFVAEEAVDTFLSRKHELELRIQVGVEASVAAQWMGELRQRGKLRILPLPVGPLFPEALRGSSVMEGWRLRAYAARELGAAYPELVLVQAELTDVGLRGVGPPLLLEGLSFAKETFRRIHDPYVSVVEHAVSIDEVIREIAPQKLRLLARAGYPSALAGPELQALWREYGTLERGEAREILLGTLSEFHRDRLPQHAMTRLILSQSTWATAIWAAWQEAGPSGESESARFAAELLSLLAEVDRDTRFRGRFVEATYSALVVHSVAGWNAFFRPGPDDGHVADSETSGARLWRTLGKIAARDPSTRAAMELGVASSLRGRLLRDVSTPLVCAVVATVVASVPRMAGLDLTDSALAFSASRPDLRDEVLKALGDGRRTLLDVLLSCASIGTADLQKIALDELDIEFDFQGEPARVPLEGVVFQLPTVVAAEAAVELSAHDAGLSRALAQWAGAPTPSTVRALRLAFDLSPLRAVRTDPSVICWWSAQVGIGPEFPRSFQDLRNLLGEPDDIAFDSDIAQVLARRAAEGGEWAGGAVGPELLRQLGNIPGMTLGAAAVLRGAGGHVGQSSVEAVWGVLSDHANVTSGTIAEAISVLAEAGKARRHWQVRGEEVDVPTRLADFLVDVLNGSTLERPKELSFADAEPDIVRLCGFVVSEFAGRVHIRAGTWLAWRLFAWVAAQLLRSPDRGEAFRRLATTAPDPMQPEECPGDVYDPRRMASGRIAMRELTVLQALYSVVSGGNQAGIDWRVVSPALMQVSTRPYSPDERALRLGWTTPSLGGPALVAPDLALFLLAKVDPEGFWTLPPESRLSRLDEALNAEPGDDLLSAVHRYTLVVFGLSSGRWSDVERRAIEDRLRSEEVLKADDAGALLLIGAWANGFVAAESPAREATLGFLGRESSALIAGLWLGAAAGLNALGCAVALLLKELAARDLEPEVYVRRLGGVFEHGGKESRFQVLQVLAELGASESPRIADVAAEVLAQLARRVEPDAGGPGAADPPEEPK